MIDPSSAVEVSTADDGLEKLMVRYQMADEAGTAALIQAVSPLLFRFFAGRSGSREDAADLLQDTWLKIHKARHTYRPGQPVLPWIFGVARHVQVDGFRRQQRIRSREQATEVLPERVVHAGSGTSNLPNFETIIAALPESQREVVTMLKVMGMSVEEVARATSTSVGAVKQKAHRAYEKLRQTLQSRPAGGDREIS